ncbi:hypothetical protein IW261DRAFT_1642868 [Armillaria novae-zelandiae]|uniref:Uncharacterized protein n=1 Tax=Armillaria novae-zelandiae TaxID=153914 RepID=A0AA39P2Z4_9AGAR|nr:hypothetical protein IW261DRAFT_1642868 [Armillaria novae-zelandiae]
MPATTTSVLAYSFLTAFTKNIPLTVFILVILFIFTIFAIYKTTKLLHVRRDRARWMSKRELILDLEAKRPSDENSILNATNERPPPISHLRPKTGDRIRSLHRRLITSSGSAEPIFVPLNVGRGSTSGSDDPSAHMLPRTILIMGEKYAPKPIFSITVPGLLHFHARTFLCSDVPLPSAVYSFCLRDRPSSDIPVTSIFSPMDVVSSDPVVK